MRAFRLCRANYPAYDGEGTRRVGGWWNSKGTRVLYMSENRSLAVLEILVHLSASIPDRYVLGAADIPDEGAVEILDEGRLPASAPARNTPILDTPKPVQSPTTG